VNPGDWSFDAVAVKLSGLVGAIVSMRFLSGTWPQRIFTALAGAVVSYYFAPWLAIRIGIPEGLTGFLLGLFGMAVLSRGWELVQAAPIGEIWNLALDWFRRRGPPSDRPERGKPEGEIK
jgi:hypothetical protein